MAEEESCGTQLSAKKIFLKDAIECLNIEACEDLDIVLKIFANAICQAGDTEFCDIVMTPKEAFELIGDPLLFTSLDLGTEIDTITTGVTAITRGDNNGIFNPLTEIAYIASTSPGNTEWNSSYTDVTLNGFTTLGDVESRIFLDFDAATGGNPFANVVGLELVMHDLTTDKYYTFVFSQYSQDGTGGGFAYTRQEFALVPQCTLTFSDGTSMTTAVKGVVSINWTSNSGGQPQGTQGTTDTYTITYTDATTTTFVLTNGANGTNGSDALTKNQLLIADMVGVTDTLGTTPSNWGYSPSIPSIAEGDVIHMRFMYVATPNNDTTMNFVITTSAGPVQFSYTPAFGANDVIYEIDVYIRRTGANFECSWFRKGTSPTDPYASDYQTAVIAIGVGATFDIDINLIATNTGEATANSIVINHLRV